MVWEDCVTTMQYLAFSPSQVQTYFQLINFDTVTAKQIVKLAVNWIYQVLLLIKQMWLHLFLRSLGINGYFLFLFLIRSLYWKTIDKPVRKKRHLSSLLPYIYYRQKE